MNGIIIICLKKPSYAMGAFNLAQSIKHFNSSVNITLVSDGEHKKHYRSEHYSPFDHIKEISLCDYIDKNGKFQPALAKINIDKYSHYDHTLYIDADSLVLKDIQPFIDSLILSTGNFYSHAIGSGKKDEEIDYSPWATNERIWSFFNLKEDQKITTINTSWFYFNNKAGPVFIELNKNWIKGFKEEDLKNKWGKSLPDELFFVGTLAQMNIDPTFKPDAMFFGDKIDSRTFSELETDYYAFTLFGGYKTVRDVYSTWYDRLMFKYCEAEGIEHRFKAHGILTGKHVNA